MEAQTLYVIVWYAFLVWGLALIVQGFRIGLQMVFDWQRERRFEALRYRVLWNTNRIGTGLGQ